MTRGNLKRLAALEEAAAKKKAGRVPLADLPGFLFAVLGVVFDEAGPEVGGRVAGRIVGQKAAQVEALAHAHGWPA